MHAESQDVFFMYTYLLSSKIYILAAKGDDMKDDLHPNYVKRLDRNCVCI